MAPLEVLFLAYHDGLCVLAVSAFSCPRRPPTLRPRSRSRGGTISPQLHANQLLTLPIASFPRPSISTSLARRHEAASPSAAPNRSRSLLRRSQLNLLRPSPAFSLPDQTSRRRTRLSRKTSRQIPFPTKMASASSSRRSWASLPIDTLPPGVVGRTSPSRGPTRRLQPRLPSRPRPCRRRASWAG